MTAAHSPGRPNALMPAGNSNLEVVLHDPRNQKMVVWDPDIGAIQLQDTAPEPRVCPFCHQTLPDEEPQWRHDWQRGRHRGLYLFVHPVPIRVLVAWETSAAAVAR